MIDQLHWALKATRRAVGAAVPGPCPLPLPRSSAVWPCDQLIGWHPCVCYEISWCMKNEAFEILKNRLQIQCVNSQTVSTGHENPPASAWLRHKFYKRVHITPCVGARGPSNFVHTANCTTAQYV